MGNFMRPHERHWRAVPGCLDAGKRERRDAVTRRPDHAQAPGQRLVSLMLGALGIVYGDIGTSPLYAMRECFHGPHAVLPTAANVLGVLSVIFWALILIISVKYLVFVM